MHRLILQLDRMTNPTKWLSVQGAVKYYVIDKVIQNLGNSFVILHGGISRQTGRRSEIRACSIIMIDGADPCAKHHNEPLLTNRCLFVRDRLLCAYCGRKVKHKALTRDHIQPISRGGEDTWMNCVACCARCNQRKGNRRPEEAGMELLFAPYIPDWNEGLMLSNRRILTDQMIFLLARIPERNRLRQSSKDNDNHPHDWPSCLTPSTLAVRDVSISVVRSDTTKGNSHGETRAKSQDLSR